MGKLIELHQPLKEENTLIKILKKTMIPVLLFSFIFIIIERRRF